MLTILPENFEATRNHNYKLQGFTRSQRKKTERMEIGDRLIYYVKQKCAFPASATIISKMFKSKTSIWTSHRSDEEFENRVEIKTDIILDDNCWIDARYLAPRLDYVRKWPQELWEHAFYLELHLLPRTDFLLLESEMLRIVKNDSNKAIDLE
jgi:hypothetical protein